MRIYCFVINLIFVTVFVLTGWYFAEALQSFRSMQRVMPDEQADMDVEVGRAMSFEMANGTAAGTYIFVWMQTRHGKL